MCPKDQFEEWYKCDCLMGTCELCGLDLLPLCPDENNPNHDFKDDDFDFNWRRHKKVTTCVSKAWRDRKCNKVCPVCSTPEVFFLLQNFITHNYAPKWQDCPFKESLHSLLEDSMLSVVGFAKFYTFAKQNEVQEAHWNSLNVTILVQITYYLNPTTDPNRKEMQLSKDVHFYISNDGKHDTLFVQHCLLLHWNHMTKGGFIPTKQYVWFNGCIGQF